MPRRLSAVPDSPRRAGLYVRVSAVMGRGDETFRSPDLQLDAMRRYATSRGLAEVATWSDIDRSGRDFHREGVQAALAAASAGEIDVLVVYDLARLGRNTGESLRVIADLRSRGVALASTVEQIDDTPEGQFMLGQFLGMAQLYSDQISRRWREVARFRAEHGLTHGPPPLGYRPGVKGGPMVVDEGTAPLVVELFEKAAAGWSTYRLQDLAARRLGRSVARTRIPLILANPAYVGKVRLGGREYDGRHEPIVDEALFRRVQRVRARAARTPPRQLAAMYALTGLVVCDGCEELMNHHTVVDRDRVRRLRLECKTARDRGRPCAGAGMPRAVLVEDWLLERVAERVRLLELDDAERALVQAGRSRARVDAKRLRRELAATDEAIARLTVDRARRLMSERAFLDAQAQLQAARDRLAVSLAEAESVLDVGSPAGVRRAGEALLAAWPEMNAEERNRALRTVVRVVRLRRGSRWREPVADRLSVAWVV